MSKPWFNITSVTYSNTKLTLQYQYGRLRGNVFGTKTLTLDGFSGSQTITLTDTYNLARTDVLTIGALGTNSNATYTDPTAVTWTFGGAPSTSTNARLTLGSTQLSSFTSSGTDLTAFLSGLASSVNSTNTKGVVVATTSNTISVSAPNTGNLYNDTQLFLNLSRGSGTVLGTSSFGASNSGTFSGGVTTYNLQLSLPSVGGYVEQFSVTSNTASVLF